MNMKNYNKVRRTMKGWAIPKAPPEPKKYLFEGRWLSKKQIKAAFDLTAEEIGALKSRPANRGLRMNRAFRRAQKIVKKVTQLTPKTEA